MLARVVAGPGLAKCLSRQRDPAARGMRMGEEGDRVLKRLGATLRTERKALGLTLVAVARASGLSAGFLSQAERGLAAPSLSSLRALARTLGIPMASLLAQPDGADRVTRKGERMHFGLDPGTITYERLTSRFAGHLLNGVLIHEPPGHRSEPISHEGEELFFILSGELTVELGGEVHLLKCGDSLHFSSGIMHSTWNHTGDRTVILHVCTMDVFEDREPQAQTSASNPDEDMP